MTEKKFPDFEAVIFDLDGVITKTESIHSAAWKKTFDDYLRQREKEYGEKFRGFTGEDYLVYVDGKPRYKGVASFIESRGIKISWGSPDDLPGTETVCGLGNLKNETFNKLLEKERVEIYPSSKVLLNELKKSNVRLGVASSSKNCKTVLKSVGMLHFFDVRVDGVDSAELGLQGKPKPDIFIKACEMLQAAPSRSIVIEDAVSGVRAGSNGGFGLTLGVDRDGNADELKQNGANWVVTDLKEVNGIHGLNDLFLKFSHDLGS